MVEIRALQSYLVLLERNLYHVHEIEHEIVHEIVCKVVQEIAQGDNIREEVVSYKQIYKEGGLKALLERL